MTVGSKNKQKTTLIKAVCGTKNAPALPPWWCMEYTHLPSWLQITTPCTDYCSIVVLASVLLLVRRFTCSLCLAHHLKQKNLLIFDTFLFFALKPFCEGNMYM